MLQRPVGNVGGHGVENLGWMGQIGLSVMLYCQSLFLPQVCRSFLESVGYIVLGCFFFFKKTYQSKGFKGVGRQAHANYQNLIFFAWILFILSFSD